jgi:hypothetical protein
MQPAASNSAPQAQRGSSIKQAGRAMNLAIPMVGINTTQNGGAYLESAHACAPIGVSHGRTAFRSCVAKLTAGSEAIDDGPQMSASEAYDLWRTASVDLGNVVTAFMNTKLITPDCHAALGGYIESAINNYDRVIEAVHAAVGAGQFRRVEQLVTEHELRRLSSANRKAAVAVQKACYR